MAKNHSDSRRRRNIKDVGFYYKKKFRWLNTCVYCGQPKDCYDHVMPVSVTARIDLSCQRVRHELRKCLYLVACCSSCNLIASNKPFDSILKKRAFIQSRLYKKHYKKIRTVIWEKDEIDGLGRNLRSQVLKMLNNRYVIENRIFYPIRQTRIPHEVISMFTTFNTEIIENKTPRTSVYG